MHEKALLPNYIYMRINELNEPKKKKSNNEIKSNSNNTEHQERLGRVNILTTF